MSLSDILNTIQAEREAWEERPDAAPNLTEWMLRVGEICEGQDLRRVLIMDIAREMGVEVLAETCRSRLANNRACGAPMLQRKDQDFAFCWLCVTARENATRSRAILLKAKLAVAGTPVLAATADDEEDERPFWPDGMPL